MLALLGVLTASKASFSLLRLPMMGARLLVSDFIDGREVDAGEEKIQRECGRGKVVVEEWESRNT